jgi:hypothetical protein
MQKQSPRGRVVSPLDSWSDVGGMRVEIPTCLIYFCGKNISQTREFYWQTCTSLAKASIFVFAVGCNYVYMLAYSSKTRPNSDSIYEDVVHMIHEIGHVHWLSNHLLTGAVNARQARMTPTLHWMHAWQRTSTSDNNYQLLYVHLSR